MPIVLNKLDLKRRQLKRHLMDLLAQQSASAQLKLLVAEAIEALTALHYGETQALFIPAAKPKSWDGSKPYTLRKLRMEALGFADNLIKRKYKGELAALRTVATEYGIKADTLRGWRKSKKLGKTNDALMKSFRENKAHLDLEEVKLLQELKKAGANYILQNKLAHSGK